MVVLSLLKQSVMYKLAIVLSVVFTPDILTNTPIPLFVALQPKFGPRPPRLFLGV